MVSKGYSLLRLGSVERSEKEQFKQLLQESEQRLISELQAMKYELMEHMKIGSVFSTETEDETLSPLRLSLQRAKAMEESNQALQQDGNELSDLPLLSQDDDQRGQERAQEQVLKSGGSSEILRRSSSLASTWEPEQPDAIMNSYINLMQEERGNASELSQDLGTLRRMAGGLHHHHHHHHHNPFVDLNRNFVESLVTSHAFDTLASLFVVTNAAAIGLEVHMRCVYKDDMPQVLHKIFGISSIIFLIFFTAEWVMRVSVYRCSFFSCVSDSCHWNWLDTLSVGLQILDQAYFILIRNPPKVGAAVGLIRIMRVLRVLRIFRVLRLLHLSDELGMLAHAIARSLSTVLWALVLMVLITYAFSVTFTERVYSETDGSVHGRLAYYFSDVPRTMLTLTESVLGGVSWDEAVWLLFTEVGYLTGFMFVIFIFLGFFILCNVVTGVFNEGVSKSTEQEASRQLAMQLQLAIGMNDPAESHHHMVEKITWKEFKDKVLNDHHMRSYFNSINIEPTAFSARKVFDLLDVNGDHVLTRGEVFYGCLKLREPARAVDVSLLMHNMAQIEKALEYLILNTNRLNSKLSKSLQTPSFSVTRSEPNSDRGFLEQSSKGSSSRKRISFASSKNEEDI